MMSTGTCLIGPPGPTAVLSTNTALQAVSEVGVALYDRLPLVRLVVSPDIEVPQGDDCDHLERVEAYNTVDT